jgi:hypothetical protein
MHTTYHVPRAVRHSESTLAKVLLIAIVLATIATVITVKQLSERSPIPLGQADSGGHAITTPADTGGHAIEMPTDSGGHAPGVGPAG